MSTLKPHDETTEVEFCYVTKATKPLQNSQQLSQRYLTYCTSNNLQNTGNVILLIGYQNMGFGNETIVF